MYQKITKTTEGANICIAMEREPISKNRVNSRKTTGVGGSFLAMFAVAVLFSSCTITSNVPQTYQHVEVNIDAYSNRENISNKKALLVCNDENISKTDLKNLEFERYIKKMLEPKGYTFTSDNEEANIVIFYEYGISDPKEYTSQRIVPVWGQTGVRSSSTTARTDSRGRTTYNTTYTPSYGVVDNKVVTETEIKYMRWANFSAFDADYYRRNGEDKEVWRIEMKSEGESGDIRYIFPYMMVAAREYVGQNRNQKITENVASKPVDRKVLELQDNLVTVITNKATSGRQNPQATVYQDVYRNGELYIRAGTHVDIKRQRQNEDLVLLNFSTTSVYGKNIALKGRFTYYGIDRSGVRLAGMVVTLVSVFILSPIGVPLWCVGDSHPKLPEGTLLYLEME